MAKKKNSTSILRGGVPLRAGEANSLNEYQLDALSAARGLVDRSYTPEWAQKMMSPQGMPLEKGTYEPGGVNFGDSQYDEGFRFHPAGGVEDFRSELNEYRAQNQPWYTQLGNGVAKMGITAGTTFVDGTIGLLAGITGTIAGTASGQGFWNSLSKYGWNNPITKAMQDVSDWSEKVLPNYYSKEEMEEPWWKNIFTANFIGDKFIKNLGFTLGAYYSGKVWTLPISLLGKAGKAGRVLNIVKEAEAAGNLQRANKVRQIGERALNANRFAQSVTGSFISSVNEGAIEALNNSREVYNQQSNLLTQTYHETLNKIQEQVKLGLMTEEQASAAASEELQKYNKAQDLLKERITRMGNSDFMMNLPILMASNLWQFGKLYGNGWTMGRKGLVGSIKDGYENTITNFTGIRKGLTNTLSEGSEEWLQKAAATTAENQFTSDILDYYKKGKKKTDVGSAANWLNSVGKALNDTWNDGSSWEEFFIGALTGALGMPSFGKSTTGARIGGKHFGLEGGIFGENRYYRKLKKENEAFADYVERRKSNPESNFDTYYRGLSRHFSFDNDMQKAIDEGDKFSYKNSEFAQMISDIEMFSRVGKTKDIVDYIQNAVGGEITSEDIQIAKEFTTKQGLSQSQKEELQGYQNEYDTLVEQEKGIQENIDNKVAKIIDSMPNASKEEIDSAIAKEESFQEYDRQLAVIDEQKKSLVEKATTLNNNKEGNKEGVFINPVTQEEESDENIKKQIEKQRDTLINTIKEYNETIIGIREGWGQDLPEEALRNAAYIQMQSGNFVQRISDLGEAVKPSIRSAIGEIRNRIQEDEIKLKNETDDKQKELLKKSIENNQNNVSKLLELLNSENNFSLGFALGKMPELSNFLKATLNMSLDTGQEVKDKVNESLQDLPKLIKVLDRFNKKYQEYREDPSKISKDIENADKSIEKSAERAAIDSFKEELKGANSLTAFRGVMSNAQDPSVVNTALQELENEGDSNAKNFRLLDISLPRVENAISNAIDSDDNDSEVKPILKNALPLIVNELANTAKSIDDLSNIGESTVSNVIDDNKSQLNMDDDAAALLKSIVSKAIKETVRKLKSEEKQRKSNAAANRGEVTRKEEPPTTVSRETYHPPYGDITTEELEEDAKTELEQEDPKNEGEEGHKYYHPIIPEMKKANGSIIPFNEAVPGYDSIYEYLQSSGAFTYLNSGKLKKGARIYFIVSNDYNEKNNIKEEADKMTIFMAVKPENSKEEYQIVGVLPTKGAVGLETLRKNILQSYLKSKQNKNNNAPTTKKVKVKKKIFTKKTSGLSEEQNAALGGRGITVKLINSFDESVKKYFDKSKDINDFFSRVIEETKGVKDGNKKFDIIFKIFDSFVDKEKEKGNEDEVSNLFLDIVNKINTYSIYGFYDVKEEEVEVEIETNAPNTGTNVPATIMHQNTPAFVYSQTTRVAQMMTGKVKYGKEERDLLSLFTDKASKDSAIFAMVDANGTLQIPNNKNADFRIIKKQNMYLTPGRLYLLIKTGAGTYIPTAVRVKHFNKEEAETVSALYKKRLFGENGTEGIFEKIAKANSKDTLNEALKELQSILYIGKIRINFFENDGNLDLSIAPFVLDDNGVPKQDTKGTFIEDDNKRVKIPYVSNGVETNLEDRKQSIIDAIYALNLPFQVSKGQVNESRGSKSVNSIIIDSNILTSNLESINNYDTWFVTNYMNDNGETQSAEPPSGIKVEEVHVYSKEGNINLLGGKENTTNEAKVIIRGEEILVNLEKGYIIKNGNQTLIGKKSKNDVITDKERLFSLQQWEDIIWAQEFADKNGLTVTYKGVTYAIIRDDKNPKNSRVINLYTGTYAKGGLKTFIISQFFPDSSIDDKIQRAQAFIAKLEENQKLVDKEHIQAAEEEYSTYYFIKEEDDNYHKYPRVHAVRDKEQNYGPYFKDNSDEAKTKREKAASGALKRGSLADDIVRNFFNHKRNPNIPLAEKPDGITEEAYKKLIDRLEDLYEEFQERGEEVYANNLVVWSKVTNSTTGEVSRLAGEIDILTVDAVGDIRIYDLKTSKYRRWNNSGNLDSAFIFPSTISGWETTRSVKEDHEIQTTAYADMVEISYTVPVSELYEIPLQLSTVSNRNDSDISDILLEKEIKLNRITNKHLISHTPITPQQPTPPVQPESTWSYKKGDKVKFIDPSLIENEIEIGEDVPGTNGTEVYMIFPNGAKWSINKVELGAYIEVAKEPQPHAEMSELKKDAFVHYTNDEGKREGVVVTTPPTNGKVGITPFLESGKLGSEITLSESDLDSKHVRTADQEEEFWKHVIHTRTEAEKRAGQPQTPQAPQPPQAPTTKTVYFGDVAGDFMSDKNQTSSKNAKYVATFTSDTEGTFVPVDNVEAFRSSGVQDAIQQVGPVNLQHAVGFVVIEPGVLQREEGGWTIVKKAKIQYTNSDNPPEGADDEDSLYNGENYLTDSDKELGIEIDARPFKATEDSLFFEIGIPPHDKNTAKMGFLQVTLDPKSKKVIKVINSLNLNKSQFDEEFYNSIDLENAIPKGHSIEFSKELTKKINEEGAGYVSFKQIAVTLSKEPRKIIVTLAVLTNNKKVIVGNAELVETTSSPEPEEKGLDELLDDLGGDISRKNGTSEVKNREVRHDISLEKQNIKKELEWLDKVLPQINKEQRLQVARGLIHVAEKGIDAWGQYWNGIITISDVAAKGTVYHEAFHLVFDLMTSPEEREELFAEARKKWGNISSEIELEELMAEDFREYVESEAEEPPKGLGQRIIDFFRSLWEKITGYKYIKNHLEAYYHRINKGGYANKKLGEGRIRESYTQEMKDIEAKAKADGTFMKAPNGKNSNLNEKQWLQVRTKAFKEWFGDWKNDPDNASKVVDENGEPLVVYHSTRANFNTFDLNKSKRGEGIWFKPWRDDSTIIGKIVEKLSRSHDIPVYLNIKNPVIVDKPSGYKSGDIYTRKGINKHSTSDNDGAIGFSNMNIFRNAFNINDIRGKNGVELVVFDSTQVKSATDNVGTFDGNNPDIRFREVEQNREEANAVYDEVFNKDYTQETEDKEIIQGELGVKKDQLIALLGSTMYKANTQTTAVKELLQNAFDAVKIAKNQNEIKDAVINVNINSKERTVTISDNGTGMSPEIVQKAFFTIGGSYKGENVDNRLKSGGLGLAKMAFLFSSEYVEVSTVRNGIKTYVNATPEQIQNDNFVLTKSKTNEKNGTTVTVKIPEYYYDENDEKKKIYFDSNPSFLHKPMIGDVTVNIIKTNPRGDTKEEQSDKNKVPEGYTYIGNAKSDFGDIEIYIAPYNSSGWGIQNEILISGLHQFNHSIRPGDGKIKVKTIINILPTVGVESAVYPINNQREGFRATISPEIEDLNFLIMRINDTLNRKSITDAFRNTISMDVGEVAEVERKAPNKNLIEETVNDVIKDLNIKSISQNENKDEGEDEGNVITLESIRTAREKEEKERRSSFDSSDIKLDDSSISSVDTSSFDISKPIFHNNTTMRIEEDGQKVLEELGALLLELKSLYLQTYEGEENLKAYDRSNICDYIKKQFWGFSFDKSYGGVNVAPSVLNLLAINPFYEVPKYKNVDVARSLTAYITHVIKHEFNHNYVRSEGSQFTGRFPRTEAEFFGIGDEFTNWENKLYTLIDNNLQTFIKYEEKYRLSTNVGEAFEGHKLTGKEDGRNRSIEINGKDLQGNRSSEDVSESSDGFGKEVSRLYEEVTKQAAKQTDSISETFDKARAGDKEAIAKLTEYGIPIGNSGVYRFVSKEEVDAVLSGEAYQGRFNNGRVDVTSNKKGSTGTSNSYRITFNSNFDLYKGLNGRTSLKNEQLGDGYILNGYSLNDIDKIEKLEEDGTYTTIWDKKIRDKQKEEENEKPLDISFKSEEGKKIESEKMRENLETFMANFGITIRDLSEYPKNAEPMFDALNKVIYTKSVNDLTDGVGLAIAFMMQYNPTMVSLLKNIHAMNKGRYRRFLNWLQKHSKFNDYNDRIWPFIDKKSYIEVIGKEIAETLRAYYKLDIDKSEERAISPLLDIIGAFMDKLSPETQNRVLAMKNWYENIANAIVLNDKTVILGSNAKPDPGIKKDTKLVNIEETLKNFPYEENIISTFNKYGFSLAGSAAMMAVGSVYRPSENILHDLDFQINTVSKEELDKIVKENYKYSALVNVINNEGNHTYTYVILDRPFTYNKYGGYGEFIDNETGKVLGRHTHARVFLSKKIKGISVDFFQSKLKYPDTVKRLNGKDYLISDYRNALSSKIDWAREKDIFDYSRFNSFDSETGKTVESIQRKPLEERIQEAQIIWAHPAIGKSYFVENSDMFIDWDNEFTEKKRKVLREIADPEGKLSPSALSAKMLNIQLNLKDHKKLLDLYNKEWTRVKEKAKEQNKKIITGSGDLLKLFKDDFEVFINMPQQTFIERHQKRVKGRRAYYTATSWKQDLNRELALVDSKDIYTTDKYFSDIMREVIGVSWETLTEEERKDLQDLNWNKEDFNKLPKDAREEITECIGF